MREETERQFRELLEQHDREFLKSVTPSTERALREQEFDRRFHERAKEVIEPIMTKLRAERGYSEATSKMHTRPTTEEWLGTVTCIPRRRA